MSYPPGDSTLRQRLIPAHARESIDVFEYWSRGLTAYTRQPKGIIDMIRGLAPMRSSKLVALSGWSVGPDVRLMMSIECCTASGQKPTGAALEKVVERLKDHKLTIRNVPIGAEAVDGACIFTGEPAVERVLLAKAY